MKSIAHRLKSAIFYTIFLCFSATTPVMAETLDLTQFSAKDASGQSQSLATYYGKPVMLHFWATWCAPCVKELPEIDALQKKYKDQGLVVLALSEDTDAAVVSAFLQKNNITQLPVLIDERSAVFRAVKGMGLPYTILIKRDGRVALRYPGTKRWMQENLKAFLE